MPPYPLIDSMLAKAAALPPMTGLPVEPHRDAAADRGFMFQVGLMDSAAETMNSACAWSRTST